MSIGEALAAARQRAGLSVAEVSQYTRIRQSIITGIEGDDYSVCGGDFYARGHIRSIARAVGADPEPLVANYDAVHRAPGPASATGLNELVTMARTAERRRMNRSLTAGVVLVLALGLVGYFLLFSGSGPGLTAAPAASSHAASHHPSPASPSAASPTAASPSPTAAATPAAQALAPARAAALGTGGADHSDNPQLARLAIDRSSATAWHTDWYASARFGNLYPGTGLLLDMGRPVTLTRAHIILGRAPGASFQIRMGSAPSTGSMRTVAREAGAGGVVNLPFAAPARGRYLLLWFTRLPQIPAGTYQASVHEIRLRGRP